MYSMLLYIKVQIRATFLWQGFWGAETNRISILSYNGVGLNGQCERLLFLLGYCTYKVKRKPLLDCLI